MIPLLENVARTGAQDQTQAKLSELRDGGVTVARKPRVLSKGWDGGGVAIRPRHMAIRQVL